MALNAYLIRCMGGSRCNHAPGSCTADPEYQAQIRPKPELKVIDSVPVSDDVVATLEEVFKAARAGEISHVAIATVDRDGCACSARSFIHSTAAMLGSIELMKLRIIRSFEGY